jgi:hypothetical protein
VRLGPFKTALACTPEALRRAPVGFHLRHLLLHFDWPCYVPDYSGRCRRDLA